MRRCAVLSGGVCGPFELSKKPEALIDFVNLNGIGCIKFR